MKVVLIALNATYGHTNLAIRYLKNYSLSDSFIGDSIEILCKEFSINDYEFNILEELVNENAKVYAFSCYIWNIKQILEISHNLKRVMPDSLIVFGGPEVSYEIEELIHENNFIDYIVKGQGEEAFRRLLLYIHDANNNIKFNSMIEKTGIISIDYNSFETSGFPYESDGLILPDKQHYYETSRGCPFSCSYCLSSVEKGLKFLSEDRVKKELKYFIDSEIKQVKLVDRTFNADDKRACNIWKYLINIYNEKPYNTNFHFEISADLLSEDSLEILSKAPKNIFRFEIGIQSTNKEVLKNVKRKSDLELLFVNISRIIKNKNIEVHLDLIAGLPGENFNIFKKSFNDVFELKPDMIQLGFLKMIKGSEIRLNAKNNNSAYSYYPPYEILASNDITFYELMKLRRIEYLIDKYYNSDQFKYSLIYVLKNINEDSFTFFDKFSEYLKKDGKFNRKLSRKDIISLYLEFCMTILNNETKKIFCDLLKFDYYRFDKKGGIDNISFNYSAGHPEFKEDRKNPDWFDKKGKWKIPKPRIEKYCFNPKKLMDEEIIQISESFVLYDLSGNKPVVVEFIIDL